MKIWFDPIGIVEVGLPEKKNSLEKTSRHLIDSVIRIFDEYVEGLIGLTDYSHVFIIYYMDRVKDVKLRLKPWGDPSYDDVGIFATRFPPRPNPIGLTVVRVIEINPPKIVVRGLDAWPGTPIIDIKPYDYYDTVYKPVVPKWFKDRWDKNSTKK